MSIVVSQGPRSLTKFTRVPLVSKLKKRHFLDFNDRNFNASTVQKTYQLSHSDLLHDQGSLESLHKELEAISMENFDFLLFALILVIDLTLMNV